MEKKSDDWVIPDIIESVRIGIVKNGHTNKGNLLFSAALIRILTQFLTDLEKRIFTYIETQKTQDS